MPRRFTPAIMAFAIFNLVGCVAVADPSTAPEQVAAISPELAEVLENLSEVDDKTLAELDTPYDITETITTIPLTSEDETGALQTIWLTVKQKRTCSYVKSKHDYESFTSLNRDGTGRVAVSKMDLHIRRVADGANYHHICSNTSWCPKTDKVYSTSGACGRSYVRACAEHTGYNRWCTKTVQID